MSDKQQSSFARFMLRGSALLGARAESPADNVLDGDRSQPVRQRASSRGKKVAFEDLLVQLILAQATTLARAGRYADAEQLVTQLLDEQEVPAALDLHARICAQQGRWREARECWQRALQLDQTNEAYVAGLQRLRKMTSRE